MRRVKNSECLRNIDTKKQALHQSRKMSSNREFLCQKKHNAERSFIRKMPQQSETPLNHATTSPLFNSFRSPCLVFACLWLHVVTPAFFMLLDMPASVRVEIVTKECLLLIDLLDCASAASPEEKERKSANTRSQFFSLTTYPARLA